jgi:hypothetical protein
MGRPVRRQARNLANAIAGEDATSVIAFGGLAIASAPDAGSGPSWPDQSRGAKKREHGSDRPVTVADTRAWVER